MTITASLFEAFLKCPTKCWLRANNEQPSGNPYAEWMKAQNESYRVAETERLRAQAPPDDSALSPPVENLKAVQWRLAVDVAAQTPELPRSSRREEAPSRNAECGVQNAELSQSLVTSAATNEAGASPGQSPGQSADGTFALLPDSALRTPPSVLETRLHAVERVPSEGRGKAAQFMPIRFIYRNKLTQDDRLLLAFDAFVLSAALGREIAIGRIIHGDIRGCARESAANPENPAAGQQTGITTAALLRAQPRVLKVKTAALAGEVRKRLEKVAELLASPAPPDLVLNRHCVECEFQARCRKIALEKDDLSLLAGNDRCMVKTQNAHRVVVVSGIVLAEYALGDRVGEAHAMVSLVEQGLADQNDVAQAFGCSARTVRRYQRRFEDGGLAALGDGRGNPRKRRGRLANPRRQLVQHLKTQGCSDPEIARRIGVSEKAVRSLLRRLRT